MKMVSWEAMGVYGCGWEGVDERVWASICACVQGCGCGVIYIIRMYIYMCVCMYV